MKRDFGEKLITIGNLHIQWSTMKLIKEFKKYQNSIIICNNHIKKIERELKKRNIPIEDASLLEMDEIWEKVKRYD